MSRSTQRGNWNKSEFQRLRIAFERGEPRTEPAGASEDESGNLPSRRRPENRYGGRTNEMPSARSGSGALMSPPATRVAGGNAPPDVPSQRHSSTSSNPPSQQRGSLTGEYSEEGSTETDSISSLDRTHTLAIGEETGQKERIMDHAAEPLMPSFSSHSQSDDSEREDHAMAAQISALSEQNQQLEAQLRDMEQERERLREMLSGEKKAAAAEATYTPPGLPSKVLDGRKVMKPGEKGSKKHLSRDEDLMSNIDSLHKSCRELEQRLHEVSEEKRRVETESTRQREALHKMQDREQDLSKDIETLRDENSHHSGTISRLQAEHNQLNTENASLLSELPTVTEKLNRVKKCYRQAEQENMHLAEELREMERERDKLCEDKMKLQLSVDDGQKTKENYRLTIRKLREENTALKAKTAEATKEKPTPPPVVKPEKPQLVSKEQQAMDEMIEMRVERTQLQEQLKSAQRDIDSLRAQIKGHSLEKQATNAIKRNVSGHLKGLHSQFQSVYDDLETARAAVTTLTEQQNKLAREQFQRLARKCQEGLRRAAADKKTLAKTLDETKRSLAKLQIEVEVVRATNMKLQSHKSVVADDVSQLRSDVARLEDQKKMLERQLSQNEKMAAEKDKTVRELEVEKKKLKSQLQSSEKTWKAQLARHERNWEDRMAEMELMQGNIEEEKEDLLQEKARVEELLSRIQSENSALEEEKGELESKVSRLESRIMEMEARLGENAAEISCVQRGIAEAVVEHACSLANVRLSSQKQAEEFASREREMESKMVALAGERDQLSRRLEESRSSREEMETRAREMREKDAKIKELTSQLDSLKTENETIRAEIRSLSELRQSAVDNLQQLSEAKQSLQLDKQKIHMTLRTEISLLQAKLKSTEEEKQTLEARVAELEAGGADSSGVGGRGRVDGQGVGPGEEREYASGSLRRQVENTEKKVPSADLHSRMMMLEAENRRLKDTLRTGKEPPDSNPALRKKIIKLSQRNFFLEWEKKDLSDKLQMHVRLLRETKEKAASEQERKLREMNHTLTEKVRGLEDSLLKRRSAIDTRITETVKENGRLHQQLIVLKNGFDKSSGQQVLVEETAEWVAREGPQALGELRAGLTSFKQELAGMESVQRRMRELQDDLQQMMNSEVFTARTLTRTSSASLPPVLKGLNPSYLSRIDSTATSPPPSSPSTPLLSPSPVKQPQSPTAFSDMKEKFQQLAELMDEAEAALRRSLDLAASREDQVALISSQFSENEKKLAEAMGLNEKLRDQFDHIDDQDLLPDQLQTIAMLQKQIESLEDQVIDRDAALQEIESQMKQDYEQHDQLIRKLNSEVLDLRNQLSAQVGKLRSKDVYIQQADSRHLEIETQLISLRKEMERLGHEREQLVAQALPEHLKMVAVATGGPVSLSDVIRLQGDEIRALQKSLVDYSYQLTQLHQQLTSADRQRSTLQAKILSEEIMQQQMKENLTAEINYLRTLNLQFVEQQAKGDKGKVLLEEVRKVKEALRQQKEATDTQRELDAANIKILELESKLEDLKFQLHTHQLSLSMLQADKQHALSSVSQDMTGQMPSAYLVQRRPMSAGSDGGGGPCRRPNYYFLNRGQPSSRNSLMQTEFAIQIPGTKGGSLGGSEIVNLEEHSEAHHNPLSLGPAVVTDDEGSRYPERNQSKVDKIKHQQLKKIRRHRRTASMGSNIIDLPPREAPNSTSTLPLSASSSSKPHVVSIVKPKPLTVKQQLSRPGSAGSNPMVGALHRVQSPERIKETAREVMKGITKLIEGEAGDEGSGGGGSDGGGGDGGSGERVNSMRRVKSGEGGKVRFGEAEGSSFTKPDHAVTLTSSLPVGVGNKLRHKHDTPRSKTTSSKSSDATPADTHTAAHPPPTSAGSSSGSSSGGKKMGGWSSRPPGTGWLKKFSRDKTTATTALSSAGGSLAGGNQPAKPASSTVAESSSNASAPVAVSTAVSSHTSSKFSSTLTTDLSRTPSILSTSSTISTFPPSTLPSRNPSFAYDGGGESSPHSLESVEIGDSIENLLALQSGRMNYSYFIPIRTKDTTSSSDEDSVRGYRHSRRKRSSGTNTDATTHSTQQSKDEDDNSNSSNDSDQLQGRGRGGGAGVGYHRGTQSDGGGGKTSAPVCRHESISITAIEDCPTDHEVDEKAAQLKKSFPRDRGQGRLRTSSTGSIHICYSDSNTSMEDVSKNF